MSDPVVPPAGRDVGIALSGGGHRATVFGLGALLAIADVGMHRRTLSISSVSGGSIANGAVMVGPDFGTSSPEEIEAHIGSLVAAVAQRGVLQGGAPATKGYLLGLIVAGVITGLGVVATIVAAVGGWPIVFGVAAVITLVAGMIAWTLFGQRSKRVEGAVDLELLGHRKTTLAEQQARNLSVHHVICTTELQSGKAFFFSNRMVYGWKFGGSLRPSDLPLATPVQASACVPGAFRPREIELGVLGLSPTAAAPGQPAVARIVLEDGGVYDNMADEWEYRFANRVERWPELATVQAHAARTMVVVNASEGWESLRPVSGGGVKFEIAGLLRSQNVQYDVSTAHRRKALADMFRESTPGGSEPDGVFVQIKDSPFHLARAWAPKEGFPPGDRNRWAAEALDYLGRSGISEDEWATVAKASAAVATTLKPLGVPVSAALLEHGYVLALVNLHVMFGLGDLSVPLDRGRFARLAQG